MKILFFIKDMIIIALILGSFCIHYSKEDKYQKYDKYIGAIEEFLEETE